MILAVDYAFKNHSKREAATKFAGSQRCLSAIVHLTETSFGELVFRLADYRGRVFFVITNF